MRCRMFSSDALILPQLSITSSASLDLDVTEHVRMSASHFFHCPIENSCERSGPLPLKQIREEHGQEDEISKLIRNLSGGPSIHGFDHFMVFFKNIRVYRLRRLFSIPRTTVFREKGLDQIHQSLKSSHRIRRGTRVWHMSRSFLDERVCKGEIILRTVVRKYK